MVVCVAILIGRNTIQNSSLEEIPFRIPLWKNYHSEFILLDILYPYFLATIILFISVDISNSLNLLFLDAHFVTLPLKFLRRTKYSNAKTLSV